MTNQVTKQLDLDHVDQLDSTVRTHLHSDPRLYCRAQKQLLLSVTNGVCCFCGRSAVGFIGGWGFRELFQRAILRST